MTGRSHLRSCEDTDTIVLQYAEFKALAISDPRIKEKIEIDNEISKLQILKSSWKAQQSSLQSDISHHYPNKIHSLENAIKKHMEDIQTFIQNKPAEFSIILGGKAYDERVKAGEHLKILSNKLGLSPGDSLVVGCYAGFTLSIVRQFGGNIDLYIEGKGIYQTALGDSDLGNITRLENLAENIEKIKIRDEQELENTRKQFADAKLEAQKPFEHEEKLVELLKRQVELNMALEFKDVPDDVLLDGSNDDMQDDENEGKNEDRNQEKAGKIIRTARSTLAERNYDKLCRLAGSLVEGNRCYMKFKSEGFEDLVVEKISRNEISIAHYYEKNGDMMRDPEITLRVDTESGTVEPLSYLQDDMGIYYETQNCSEAKKRELSSFLGQWLTNISRQGYTLYMENTEEENEAEDDCYMER